MRRVGLVLWVLVGATGCFAISETDRYSFDVDPCPPAPPECTGGQRYTYLQTFFDIARVAEDGSLDGFDLDGTDRAVCGRADHVSSSGRSGIDNELTALVVSSEQFSGMRFTSMFDEAWRRGEQLSLYVLDHVDSFENDDCVSMQFVPGIVPDGEEPASYVDADGDGTLDSGLTLDFGSPSSADPTACIVDGRLHVRVEGTQSVLLGSDAPPASVRHVRFECDIESQALDRCLFGGAIATESLLDPTLGPIFQGAADTDFDGRRCRAVSFAMSVEATDVVLGQPRL